jgi:hypothetical protein
MKALIWKEWLENLKWVPVPGLVILVVFLIDRPLTPMPDVTLAFFYALTAVAFGAALGFVQIYFDGHGDMRSLLLHRPLSRSRIFLAKALAGVALYAVALGVPFVCLELWLATPDKISAPYHWRTSLPWLADILSGLVYYFGGMLVAQRDVRWYGSRGLALAAAFLCSYLVWAVPAFWQAVVATGIIGSFVAVAAWGGFCAGGACAPRGRVAKTALAVTFVAGLLIVSVLGKQVIGDWTSAGIEWDYRLDRRGRMLLAPFKEGVGEVGPWIDLTGQEPADLKGKVVDSRVLAPWVATGRPLDWSYRNSGRFYVPCTNASTPGDEIWFYDQSKCRLFGFDPILHYSVGSFGPDGFCPPGRQPGDRFEGTLCYQSTRWQAEPQHFLAFPGRVYGVDFGRRKIRRLFTPAQGETVTFAGWWKDLDARRHFIVVNTDRSIHFLKDDGSPVVSLPRDREKHNVVLTGLLEKPDRYFAWYPSRPWLVEPHDYQSASSYQYVYDAGGHELARRTLPPPPFELAPYARSLFGLVTPMTEAATLVGASRYLRSEARLQGSTRKPLLLDYLENSRYSIPGTAWREEAPEGSILGYTALILLSAVACAVVCFLLARRHAFSRTSSIAWALTGFFFGWVGLVLMLALSEWPARTACPGCRILRVVTRDTCEHCGAGHATPVRDGTEIFEPTTVSSEVALCTPGAARTLGGQGCQRAPKIGHLGAPSN